MDVENRPPRRARGFTLIEIITTVATVAISLALLAPGWSDYTSRSRITTTANSLLHDLRFARSLAVTRQRKVTLCPSDDGALCSGDHRGWQRGYLLFIDTDGNKLRSADEELIRVADAKKGGLRLHSTASRPAVRFRPDGAAWSTNTTFSVCLGDRTQAYRAVVLYGSGRARVDRRLPSGQAVHCG